MTSITEKRRLIWVPFIIVLIIGYAISSCSDSENNPEQDNSDIPAGDSTDTKLSDYVLSVIPPEVDILVRGTKICQLVGEIDRETKYYTMNRTYTRYGLEATDLGVPFQHGDTTFILFGDSWGSIPGGPDVMAYTTDNTPWNGLELDFVKDELSGNFHPLLIPGISQRALEVPMEGVFVDGKMYIYHTTDHMGRSIVARQNNDGYRTFEYLYDLSCRNFINVSIVKIDASEWDFLPQQEGRGHVIFGSGSYRMSYVYLAYQPEMEIENPQSIRYFAGVDKKSVPIWVTDETFSLPVFILESPCVGELSVSYNKILDRWILLYNCNNPRGINIRTAQYPWGPWSTPQIIFHPWEDNGYCNFMHIPWSVQQCDEVHDEGRESVWGGEYGPYQFEHFATGEKNHAVIFFTLSTWNPYTAILMYAVLSMK